jgi:hypothetical protein
MLSNEALSAIVPLLRTRALRVLLIAAPGIMGAVAILTVAIEPAAGWAVVLNVIAGIIISSALFIVVSIAAHRVADDRISLVKGSDDGHWKARTRLLATHNDEDGLYTDWYFRLRVQEEIDRVKRYGTRFTLVWVQPSLSRDELDARSTAGVYFNRLRRHLRRSDLPAILKDGSLAVLLPQTARDAAVQRRLTKALSGGAAQIGVACFPGDAQQVEGLLEAAVRDAARRVQVPSVQNDSRLARI